MEPVNNLQQLIRQREAMLPDDLEFQVMRQANTMGHFGDMVELFLLNTLSTVAHIVTGGEEAKCLEDKRKKLRAEMNERSWCRKPEAQEDPLPSEYGTRTWTVPQR
jgi:hypothetical protein